MDTWLRYLSKNRYNGIDTLKKEFECETIHMIYKICWHRVKIRYLPNQGICASPCHFKVECFTKIYLMYRYNIIWNIIPLFKEIYMLSTILYEEFLVYFMRKKKEQDPNVKIGPDPKINEISRILWWTFIFYISDGIYLKYF